MNFKLYQIKVIFLIFILFSVPALGGETENDSVFVKYESELSAKAIEMSKVRFDNDLADSLCNDIANLFEIVLSIEGSMVFPFDSLKAIGKIESKDKDLRIFTWNSVRANGTYLYYGFIQVFIKEKKTVNVYRLIDKSDSIIDPETALLSADNWFGALYYDIIETKLETGTLYTLLGWDGNDLYSNKKIIESLTFSASGKPKFGKSVFSVGRSKQKRIIFEYSRMANMMITYDANSDMIVYDHLSPSEPVYQNNPAYYGPDFSYDGFKFENYLWNHVSEVDYKSTPENIAKSKKKRNR